jgi:bifunctional N-acetylglucosamine-1-phosphate-uridyltransferase/glucosamine-1-phosphate-acetyltransferase GlmU-like protein
MTGEHPTRTGVTSTTGTPLAVILAAGEGKRMKSSLPKVLHKLAGEPLLGHVLTALGNADVGDIAVVIGPNRPDVEDFVHAKTPRATMAVQHERRGTAHALLAVRDLLAAWTSGEILVLFGDTPLIKPSTIKRIRGQLSDGSDIVVTGFYPADSTGYGRLITEGERLLAIREEKDASPEELEVKLCNGGIMGIRAEACLRLLDKIGDDNSQGEYYLTDVVEIAAAEGLLATVIDVDALEISGINTIEQLQILEEIYLGDKGNR